MEKFTKNYINIKDQVQKDEETLQVIMSKEGSGENLQHRTQTQNDSGQPL